MIRELGKPGDLGWVIKAHGELYAAEYGWNTVIEGEVARIAGAYAAAHDPDRERAWIAELDGRRVGSIFCMDAGGGTALLRLLVLDRAARGRGLGGRLVDTCLDFARQAGYRRMRLWTTDPLVAARQLYLSRGFRLTGSVPHHAFGKEMLGQTYELAL
jgi:GNAT superfamily N-acetyltransferase